MGEKKLKPEGKQLENKKKKKKKNLEKRKKEKKNPPPPNFKMKKASHLECMLGPSHWLHEISLPRRVHHYFWPGLTPLAENTLPIVPIDMLNH